MQIPVNSWTAQNMSGVGRRTVCTAASVTNTISPTMSAMVSESLLKSYLNAEVKMLMVDTVWEQCHCHLHEVVFYIFCKFQHNLFLSACMLWFMDHSLRIIFHFTFKQTRPSHVKAVQAPCLCLAVSCLKQASTPATCISKMTPAMALLRMDSSFSTLTMTTTCVAPYSG